jgi:hypothetical protein
MTDYLPTQTVPTPSSAPAQTSSAPAQPASAPAPAPVAGRLQLLELSRRRFGEFPLPTGERVRFRSLSEGELSAYDNAIFERDPETDKVRVNPALQDNARARLIVLCLVDADGKPLLSDGDLEWVSSWDPEVALPLFEALRDHCGITAAVERQKKRAELKKN